MRICFLGAGSTVFAKNVMGDCILTPELGEFEIALHDINEKRLEESYKVISKLNEKYKGKATVLKFLDRRDALKGANFIINAIQVGGYRPCTVTDFRIPRRYGLQQTIGDTLGVGGIMRALRTFPVLQEFAKDIEEVCPDAFFLNYSNPMAMLTGYLLSNTKVKAVGLCHSVQSCVPRLLKELKIDIDPETTKWDIYGINHQAWLLSVNDKDGNDIYPEIKKNAKGRNPTLLALADKVRLKMMDTFGYYITESSEHTSEYVPWFIKRINFLYWAKYLIPLNEYPRRCRVQILRWNITARKIKKGKIMDHKLSSEYGSRIITGIWTNKPYNFHGSVLNSAGLIPNLPREACVEVPIICDKEGFHPQTCKPLPEQCAAINCSNITPQLLTLKAAKTGKLQDIVHAVAMDPHTGAVLTLEAIEKMTRALYKKHRKDGYLPEYK
ncbi:MAG: Alpha-galactosidase [Firmicutes bacterium ADurb.Bin080]|nr:MAG: Alpha-galactosidase [Firmicutes bacterium ADurb.Bin080]